MSFGEAVKLLGQRWKPILKMPSEQKHSIANGIFDIIKNHGPITVSNTWIRAKPHQCDSESLRNCGVMRLRGHHNCNIAAVNRYIAAVTATAILRPHQEAGMKDLTSKTQMKVVLRWMREKQKLRLVCNHVGAHKQFQYTIPATEVTVPSKRKPT
ncbi:hypothetical protein Lal_00036691 [Lupinus albus]|nr:hypothetical protein Lal_00036691 [Lupinus albus]